jgi:hypothetical protein
VRTEGCGSTTAPVGEPKLATSGDCRIVMARTKQRALQTCMGDKQVYITTTKQRSSMRQILAAIDHLHKQEFEAAITLAAAAEGQITEGAIRHLFRIMRQKLPKTDHNKVINWLKHATGEDKITITEFEAAIAIARAIHKFVGVYEATQSRFETFSD